MSIQIVEYIPCSRCFGRFLGKTGNFLCVWKSDIVSVFEVTITWICLNCHHIQDERVGERVEIREIRHN